MIHSSREMKGITGDFGNPFSPFSGRLGPPALSHHILPINDRTAPKLNACGSAQRSALRTSDPEREPTIDSIKPSRRHDWGWKRGLTRLRADEARSRVKVESR